MSTLAQRTGTNDKSSKDDFKILMVHLQIQIAEIEPTTSRGYPDLPAEPPLPGWIGRRGPAEATMEGSSKLTASTTSSPIMSSIDEDV
jgi:hypothetical protein